MKTSMDKKGRKKKPVAGNKPSQAKTSPPEAGEKDKAFDFGGIPDRNLKKNLGC